MGNIKVFSVNTACFILFPLASYMANKIPFRLTIYYLTLLLIGCFFMTLPTFIDILYVTTIFYIIIVLEVEGQAIYGINGSLILGASLALWTVTVPGTSGQLLFLSLASISIVLFLIWPMLQGAYSQWTKKNRFNRIKQQLKGYISHSCCSFFFKNVSDTLPRFFVSMENKTCH